jgi:predicted nuclease with RNAse H fold
VVLLGFALRASANRPSTAAVLDNESSVTHLGSYHTDGDLMQVVEAYKPDIIAVGAPLSLPTGLCCLESACACAVADPQRRGRQFELELARLGISCFFTNKGSIIRSLIYRGIELNQKLTKRGYKVIEVYPHATKLILFGDKLPPKNSAASVAFLRQRLPALIQGLDQHLNALDRNACDAVLNSYTALLHRRNKTDVLGTSKEGLLVLPKLLH